jgi:hypothetical protein
MKTEAIRSAGHTAVRSENALWLALRITRCPASSIQRVRARLRAILLGADEQQRPPSKRIKSLLTAQDVDLAPGINCRPCQS